jgi:Fur family ferric uptake transcriptional regulator
LPVLLSGLAGGYMSKTQQRMTKQKRVVLEELSKVKNHPTAYDVYEMVKSRLPRISLGTVYRNLDQLSSGGQIRRLDMGQSQRRFDAVVDNHLHIRCISCGKVDDVPLNPAMSTITIKDMVSSQSGYDVLGCEMDFQGICPKCKKKMAIHNIDGTKVYS